MTCKMAQASTFIGHKARSLPRGIMITNDDGPPGQHSPFLLEFTRVLKHYVLAQTALLADQPCKLFVCVPSQNQSWVGKSVTRYSDIKAYCNWDTRKALSTSNGHTDTNRGSSDIDLWATVEYVLRFACPSALISDRTDV